MPDASYTVTAQPIQWYQDSDHQWTDSAYGFSITHEPSDDLPYCAAWGEGDASQFATLDEAKAWCQSEIDCWVGRTAVVRQKPQESEAHRQLCAMLRDGLNVEILANGLAGIIREYPEHADRARQLLQLVMGTKL